MPKLRLPADRAAAEADNGTQIASEAAPRTDEACAATLHGASLPDALDPPQPRPITPEAIFGYFAQL